METDARIVVALLASLVVVAGVAAPAAASPQPSPVCPVCGDTYPQMWADSEWTVPGDRTLTVQAHENGTATWVADLRWNDPGDAPAPDEADEVASMARRAMDESLYLEAYEGVAVEVDEGRTRISWQTPGVVTERFGHGVFRPFHGEGVRQRLVVNVDELVVRAPDGQVVTTDPAVGTVTDDGTAVSVDGPERNVGDFYVVFGDERGAASAVTTEVAIGSLLWPVAGQNLLYFLAVPTWTLVIGLVGLYAVGRRRGVDPTRADRYGAAALGVGLLAVAAAVVGPLPFGALFSLPAVLVTFGALAAFGAAVAVGSRRRMVATAVAVPVIALAPLVAGVWPAVTVPGLAFLSTVAYTGLAVAVVVLGTPWFLYGMALGQRRGAAR